MEDINDVTLNFKTTFKTIKAPSTFSELKLGFLNIFDLEDKSSFSFYYILDSKNNNKTYIKDDKTYEEFIKILKNDKNLTIYINELNEDSGYNNLDDNDILKELESIKELLIKEEEINQKLKIVNKKYKDEMSQLEIEINKEEENKKEYNLNKGKYLEEIKQKEEIINENKEKINELKNLLLDKKNEKVNLEKQNDVIKNEIEEKTEEINKLENNQNEDNESDKIKNNLNMSNDIQNKINETEKETEKIRLKIKEEIENTKIIESKTNSLKDKIKKINKDKINYRKIHPLTKNNFKKEHQYSKTKIIEDRLNNSSNLNSEVIHRLENSQIIYKSKILKRKNFINELSKSINESFDNSNKKGKNINNVSLVEEDYKQIVKDKYKSKNLIRAQKEKDEIKAMLLKNKKIKESEEKLDIINNEIELSNSQILDLKHSNDQLKNEYDQISNEVINDYSVFEQSQKIDISKIFKQINEKMKKVQESKSELKSIIDNEKYYENEIDKIKSENDIQKKKEDDLRKLKINYQILESKLKGEMITNKENIQKKLKDEYEKKLKQKMKELSNDMSNKIKIEELENKKIFLKKYEQSQIKLKEKFSQISIMAKSKINNNNNKNNNKVAVCKTVHKGIKCQRCFQEPIIGYRYKCMVCNDYNLCEQCEEKNFLNYEHPHDFIKIRKERNEIEQNLISNINFSNHNAEKQNNNNPIFENFITINDNFNNNNDINPNNNFNPQKNSNNYNNNNNNMNNLNNFDKNINNVNYENTLNNNNNIFSNNNKILNQNPKNNNNFNSNFKINRSNNNLKINNGKYSYKSYSENMQCSINQGDNSIALSIVLENNGSYPWVNQKTFLFANPNNYNIRCQNIMLNPQLPNKSDTYKFSLSNLSSLNIGEYKISYSFIVDGNSYGKDLDISLFVTNRNNFYHGQKPNLEMNMENK